MCNRKLKLLNCCGMRQAGRLWDRVVVCNAYAQYVYLICSCTGCSGGMNNRASPIYKKPMANGDFTIQKFLVLNERGCHIIRLILNFCTAVLPFPCRNIIPPHGACKHTVY